jgi:UDP-glucose 4-epimerase
MNILLTGGLGYIGSHVAVILANNGHDVTIVDNLSNCKIDVLERLKLILKSAPRFVQGDIRNQTLLETVLKECNIDAVIHFAGLKAVGESVQEPLVYYDNNVGGTLSLLKAMRSCNVKTLVFSSSATVYGIPRYLPLDEDHPTNPQSPYGKTKLQIEEILKDLAFSDKYWHIIALRYFNPVGAHASGLIGEEPNGIPSNLMPYLSQVAARRLEKLRIFGGDYESSDGTGIRDYVHVMDLAEGHLAALKHINGYPGFDVMNLGTGFGHSVLELVKIFEEQNLIAIPYEIVSRRQGDIASCFANVEKAERVMGWKAKYNLMEMCKDAWRWQKSSL